jgi:hypothetical protein
LLGNNIGMAIHAEIRHSWTAPEGRMTGIAMAANFCMRGRTAEWVACLGIERARVEKNVAIKYHHGCQGDNRQDCKYNARTSETTETRIIHYPS